MTVHQTMKAVYTPSLDGLRAELRGLLAIWRSKLGPGGELPAREAFDPLLLKPYLPHIYIVAYEAATDRYRYRLIGTEITATYGRDSTGKYFDEIYPAEDMKTFRDGYDEIRLKRQPMAFYATMYFVGRDHMKLEALILPVAAPAGDNPQFLGAVYFSNSPG